MTTTAGPVATAPAAAGFDLDVPWRLDDRVSIRPEPFGALLYHFGTRRLTFLKSPLLLDVVRGLADHPTARAAVVAAGVPPEQAGRYETALASLVDGDMIVRRTPAPATHEPTPATGRRDQGDRP